MASRPKSTSWHTGQQPFDWLLKEDFGVAEASPAWPDERISVEGSAQRLSKGIHEDVYFRNPFHGAAVSSKSAARPQRSPQRRWARGALEEAASSSRGPSPPARGRGKGARDLTREKNPPPWKKLRQ